MIKSTIKKWMNTTLIKLGTFRFFMAILLILGLACEKKEIEKIDLSGTWQFRIDSLDQGVPDKWHSEDLPDTIQLPDGRETCGTTVYGIPVQKWMHTGNPAISKCRFG